MQPQNSFFIWFYAASKYVFPNVKNTLTIALKLIYKMLDIFYESLHNQTLPISSMSSPATLLYSYISTILAFLQCFREFRLLSTWGKLLATFITLSPLHRTLSILYLSIPHGKTWHGYATWIHSAVQTQILLTPSQGSTHHISLP